MDPSASSPTNSKSPNLRPRVALSGHYWTLLPHVLGRLPSKQTPSLPWEAFVDDDGRRVRIAGRLSDPHEQAKELIVIVHGMGGSPESSYCLRAAEAAITAGAAALRLGLRGASRDGADVYHAGLWGDIATVFSSDALAKYERIFVLGYSLGGHTTLRVATDATNPRLRAVAAICAPIDLNIGRRWVDERVALFYRRYLIGGLCEIYRSVAAERSVPTPVKEVERVRTMYDWDRLTVVRRFGFDDPDHYYRDESVVTRMDSLNVPTLVVCARHDPLVPAHTVVDLLRGNERHLELVVCERGGHVGFPSGLDLGFGGERGLEPQAIRWLLARR